MPRESLVLGTGCFVPDIDMNGNAGIQFCLWVAPLPIDWPSPCRPHPAGD